MMVFTKEFITDIDVINKAIFILKLMLYLILYLPIDRLIYAKKQ